MNFFRVGVIDFFGILYPGVLVVVNLLPVLFATDLRNILTTQTFKDGGLLLFLLIFVACYLCGGLA